MLASAVFLVAKMAGVKTMQKSEKSRKEPYWKRRIYKIMFKPGESILVSLSKFANGILSYWKRQKRDDL